MIGFPGVFEERADNLQGFKEARLQRLHEVRQQEKLLSSDRCNAYRKVIELRKQTKTDLIKSTLISKKRVHQNRLIQEWQGSLVDTGYGHRTASEITSRNSVRISTVEARNAERMLIAAHRGREAMFERNSELERQQKITAKLMERGSFRTTAIASDREDARAVAETKIAELTRKAGLKEQNAHSRPKSSKSSNVINMTRQSAVRIQDRGPVVKDINVMRHGKSEDDEASLLSCAEIEERNALSRQWSIVMKEMRHRNVITTRALIARQTMRSIIQGEAFKNELSLLMLADKSPCRSTKTRNVASVRAAADCAETTSNAVRAFEREFLSTSVLCTSPSNCTNLTTIQDNSVFSSHVFDHREALSEFKLAVPTKQPMKWDDNDELLATKSRHTIPVNVRSSSSLYDVIRHGINPTIVVENTSGQTIQRITPAIWELLPEEEIEIESASKLSTDCDDETRMYVPSAPAIFTGRHAINNNESISTKTPQPKNQLTELRCLPASPSSVKVKTRDHQSH